MTGWLFLIGTFLIQVAHNGVMVVMPVILLRLTDSAALFALIASLFALTDTLGTLLGGGLLRVVSMRTVIVLSTAMRAGCIHGLAVLEFRELSGLLTVSLIFTVEALFRGITDTCRHSVPLILTDRTRSALQQMNASIQLFFECGGIIGPAIAGVALHWYGAGITALILAVLPALAAAFFLSVPEHRKPAGTNPNAADIRQLAKRDPWLRTALATQVFLTTYPLKAVLPGIIALSIFRDLDLTAWLVACFSTGGVVGSLVYNRLNHNLPVRKSLKLSAPSVVLFCGSWFSANLVFISIAILAFQATNVISRLALISRVQSQVTAATYAAVISSVRFTSNLTSMALKFIIGVCFKVPDPVAGFGLATLAMSGFALGQLNMARVLTTGSPAVFDRDNPGD